ncbi:MAG: DNA gyrase inhibitor YacG [Burkholderiales bacterium]|nr:DNA gyrase inhibitor YacG [Burkholderiales bacterium]
MTEPGQRIVSCPNCGKPVAWAPESRFRPFCSSRCKLIDLGQWATEQYRVPDETRNGGIDVNDASAT